jgi:hypothetical protein
LALPTVTDDEQSDDEESVRDGDELQDRLHPDLPGQILDDIQTSENFQEEVAQWASEGTNLATVSPNLIIPDDDDTKTDFPTPKAELLAWHYRLGHISFARIKKLAERGDLPAHLGKVTPPRCAACMYGKATKRQWRTKAPLNAHHIPAVKRPGDVVGIDQLISSTPGFVAQMRGCLTGKRYKVTTVFVDHLSGYSYVHNQLSTSAVHTIAAKQAFERVAKVYGVTVKHYHADNGIFESKAFVDEVHLKGQTISFCAVSAHHQNGRAEKKIRDLQDAARTMLLHAQQRWPTAITSHLWPYAIRMANDIANSTPSIKADVNVSPVEVFAQTDVAPRVKFAHTFGSPVYVLDSRLQSGRRISKWTSKSRVGIYLGASPRHSRKVALVLSLATGLVSPQFHCQYDDLFDTMRRTAGNRLPKSSWQELAGFVDKVEPKSGGAPRPREDDPVPGDRDEGVDRVMELMQENFDHLLEEGEVVEEQAEPEPAQEELVEAPIPQQMQREVITRSGRVSRPPDRLIDQYALSVPWEVFHDGGYDIQDELEDPIAFVASSNPDIMYIDEAMRAPDREQFKAAMADEVRSHTEMNHWQVVKRSDLPQGTEVLPSVWAMRRKRRIATQEVYKWKARLNVHGGKQTKFVNYWETYSPVVGWTTIRTFLIMMITNQWVSRQVDFELAFPQAEIECEMYMEVPRGFHVDGNRKDYALRLDNNLYGQKQAGRIWNTFMHDGLIARGFKQSKVDMCVYYRGQVVFLVYVDDGIFIAPNQRLIQQAYDDLGIEAIDEKGVHHRAFRVTDEGDLADYLGVKIEQLPNGTIKLSQPHLIQQILDDLGFSSQTKSQPTPAASTIKLNRDPLGKCHEEAWDYRSVIGKLNFIEKSTRMDLAYAVHQCARFSSDPKESHSLAVKRIGRYLMGTKDKGLILDPKSTSFDCFVDADFVGNWHRVHAQSDPGTAKSRTGYVVMYASCPVVWASKLQREVALSTTEAEYNALSESLREVINMMQLFEETKDELKWAINEKVPTVHCKVFEDNSGALDMARLPKMRPRTKHICVRMHHF